MDFEAFAQRHAETERQFKEIKRALEGLREGTRQAAASITSAASAFSSAAAADPAGLARKLADAADCVEDRCRAKAEASLGGALAAVNELLTQLADKSKFDRRKTLLLDLDSYKRKVKDLREKEQTGGKVDLHTLRDKEDKLRAAERAFTDANDELLDDMQAMQDSKAAAMEAQLVAVATACADFFGGAGRACVPSLPDAVAVAKANPVKAVATARERGAPQGEVPRIEASRFGGAPADGGGGAAFKPASGGGSDPFAVGAGGGGADPFATAGARGAGGSAAPAAARGGEARQATFDYTATEAGELSFAKGDRIEVLSPDESGWWQGRNARTGATGAFPVNYSVAVGGASSDPFA